LESLRLVNLGLVGALPAEWTQPSSFPALRELELSGMPGLQIASWATLRGWLDPKGPQQLQRLHLAGLSGLAAAGLDAAFPAIYRNLSTLVLANMSLGGPISDSWSTLPAGKLGVLDLSGNQLSGSLPSALMTVMGPPVALKQQMAVGTMMMMGPPPGWLLDLSRNNLTGVQRRWGLRAGVLDCCVLLFLTLFAPSQ